ncbi:tyrosine-type recombinase/integrase [Sphingopyxis terrae subsp. ummariensis]
MFPGQSAAVPISKRQLYRVVVEAAEAADIDKRVGPHMLRHSLAIHLLEDGVDIRVIQSLLGHAKQSTFAFYAQVATKTVRSIVGPLDRLALASPSEEAPGRTCRSVASAPPR